MKKILVADDKREVLELVTCTLEGEEYKVVTASNGQEALMRIREEDPDLILLDVIMPKMNGLEVLKELRKDPNTRDTPVIMLSAMGQKQDKEKGQSLGATEYIIKPFSPAELVATIERTLE